MNLDLLTFIINDEEKIIIELDCPDRIIHSCNFSNLDLIINDKHIIVGKSIIDDYAQKMIVQLSLALSDKLKLHFSIKNNIGYYWNQKLNEENPHLFFQQDEKRKYWIGLEYLLWTTDSHIKDQQYGTWLYNDAHGNIIFEITPIYPDTFIDPEDPADVQAYQEWMEKSYQPFFTRIISKETAVQWLKQSNLILKTIKENVKILKKKYKAGNKKS